MKVNVKWGDKPFTKFKHMYDAINVKVIDAPSYDTLLEYVPQFGEATWQDTPSNKFTKDERIACVHDMFKGKYVPTVLETIGVTVLLQGVDICDVTHFLRHRMFSFSAQCTGDRDMRHDPVIVKSTVADSVFYDRYEKLIRDAKQLYADMLDSKDVHILDARTVLPRCTETFYYIRGSLNNWLAFIHQRSDIQIQPKSDVLIAMKIYEALCELYPPMMGTIDICGPDKWYINTVKTKRSSDMFAPRYENAVFSWEPSDFVYGSKTIGDFPGDLDFLDMLAKHKEIYGPKED